MISQISRSSKGQAWKHFYDSASSQLGQAAMPSMQTHRVDAIRESCAPRRVSALLTILSISSMKTMPSCSTAAMASLVTCSDSRAPSLARYHGCNAFATTSRNIKHRRLCF